MRYWIAVGSIITCLALTASSLAGQCVPGAGCGSSKSGAINGETWTTAISPVCVTGNLIVNQLTIEPGVCVLVAPDVTITVQGVLNAVGTIDAPITFTARDSGARWGGMVFPTAVPGSILQHCTVELANDSGLRLYDSAPTLIDCTFRYNWTSASGGGLHAEMALDSAEDLVLVGCRFEHNVASFHGGGLNVLMHTGTLIVEDCVVADNSISGGAETYVGGGMRAEGVVEVRNSTFERNAVSAQCYERACKVVAAGGGMYGDGSIRIENSVFRDNVLYAREGANTGSYEEATAAGGGVYVWRGSLEFHNSIVGCNVITAMTDEPTDPMFELGAGIYQHEGTATVVNSNLARNSHAGAEFGTYPGGTATAQIRNSIAFFNDGGSTQLAGAGLVVEYCDVEGGFAGTGNISYNPQFQGLGCACGDLHISSFSPAVDAGDPSIQFDDVCFPPSHGAPRNDMGANGGPGACGWLGAGPYELLMGPNPVPPAGIVSIDSGAGIPGQPLLLALTAINGVPVFVSLLLGCFGPDQRWTELLPAPPAASGLTGTFQAYGVTLSGVVQSNSVVLTFQ